MTNPATNTLTPTRCTCTLLALLLPALAQAATVTLQWDAPVSGCIPTGYFLYHKSGSGPFRPLTSAPLPATQTTYTHTNANSVTRNCYRVSTTCMDAESAHSNETCWVAPALRATTPAPALREIRQ